MNSVSPKHAVAGLASFLTVLALMGHALFHSFDIHHAHHKKHQHRSVDEQKQDGNGSSNQLTVEVRDVPKSELFNFLLTASHSNLVAECIFSFLFFESSEDRLASRAFFRTRSRAPPKETLT